MRNTWPSMIVFVVFVLVSGGGLVQATDIITEDVNSYGWNAGDSGVAVSFFGSEAGLSNTVDGYHNSFFGYKAGRANTAGTYNSFFGKDAGLKNTTGNFNSIFGATAGSSNTTGINNAFFGMAAGFSNSTGYGNGFFGTNAGMLNSIGSNNTFFGVSTGISNTTGSNNSYFGYSADGTAAITNATAIGYCSSVTQSNSLVLGGVNGYNCATAEVNVGIGTTNPDRQLTVEGTQALGRFRRYYGTTDPFTRTFAPAFLFERARPTPTSPTDIQAGDYLGKIQFRGRVGGSMPEYGAMAFIATDTSQNGRFSFLDRDITTERMVILNTGNVGINTTAPLERLHVVGNVRIDGDLIWTDPGASVPDYVFDSGYKLMGINELEKFIASEKHLPNIPSATEIKDNGLNMSDFQMKLLEKIEELTLYIVHKNAEITELNNRLKALEQQLNGAGSK